MDRPLEVSGLVALIEESERGKSTVKLILRIALVPVSLAVGLLLAFWGIRFTLVPLPSGFYEGTPITILEFFTVFPAVSIALLMVGNRAISRYFRSDNSK